MNISSPKTIVIGTRESQLALIQAHHVQKTLQDLYPSINFTINGMTTTGDQIQDIALNKIGTKALFTKELEVALCEKSVDLVVHSLKDVPTTLPDGMFLAAIMKREDPRDVVIMSLKNQGKTLQDLPTGSVIGSSSVRRIAQLKKTLPHLTFKDMRGNLNTRLRKLDDPENGYDALILAYAGVHRMGWDNRISQIMEKEHMLYAVGQGALGIECRMDDAAVIETLKPLIDLESLLRCTSERSFMRRLEGGCSVPLGVTTECNQTKLKLIGSVTSLDGSRQLRHELETELVEGFENQVSAAEQLGVSLANVLLEMGAESILKEIRKTG
ncbi:porphobilinogen deaminase, dipyromethane cofactor binding domain-containing protein [Globomyces pollinis-pini]|nr:porphobilinogen deaminase, dipyromethane cofactor binding domain-containing protein [Globomyces pollinis-pini]